MPHEDFGKKTSPIGISRNYPMKETPILLPHTLTFDINDYGNSGFIHIPHEFSCSKLVPLHNIFYRRNFLSIPFD